MTSTTTHDDQLLRAYLLGSIAPEFLEAVDTRLFSDDRIFWQHLCLVEDELIDDYVNGTLDHQDVELFERSFLSTEERRAKLEFARALLAYVDAQESRRRRSPRTWFSGSRLSAPAWAVAVAATLMLFLPIAGWQFGTSRPSADDVTAWLSSGLVRDIGPEIQRVRIPSGCKLVRLRLERDGSDYAGYRATLYDTVGQEIWSAANLRPAVVEGQPAVTVTLPADQLQGGDYVVKLRVLSAAHDFVLLNRYDFRVVRE